MISVGITFAKLWHCVKICFVCAAEDSPSAWEQQLAYLNDHTAWLHSLNMPATAEKCRGSLHGVSSHAVVMFMDSLDTNMRRCDPIEHYVVNFKRHANAHSGTQQYALVGSVIAFQAYIGTGRDMEALCEIHDFTCDGMHTTTSW